MAPSSSLMSVLMTAMGDRGDRAATWLLQPTNVANWLRLGDLVLVHDHDLVTEPPNLLHHVAVAIPDCYYQTEIR